MLRTFIQFLRRDRIAQLTVLVLIGFLIWWVINIFIIPSPFIIENVWANVYQVIALIGGVSGLFISRKWGGFHSVIGKAILVFSIGLLLQNFGQCCYAYYYTFLPNVPLYPSVGDIGFFGSIPFYIYGIVLLGKASGARVSLRSLKSRVIAVVIPVVGLIISYSVFLQGYQSDWSNPIKVFLDFGYPLGDVIYVTLALVVFILSIRILGGIMKEKIIFILIALVIQYIDDFLFLYESNNGTYVPGHEVDMILLFGYTVMTLAILQLNVKYVSPRLGQAAQTSLGERLWNQLDQVATSIIKGQATIMGPLAWNEAQQVSGIAIDESQSKAYLVGDNSKAELESLVTRYERLFGPASTEVSRESVKGIISQVPQEELPVVLI